MRHKTLLALTLSLLCHPLFSQIVQQNVSPSTLPSLIPGFSQVTSISAKSFVYTPSAIPTDVTPTDGDPNTEGNGAYFFGDAIDYPIQLSDGNITQTSAGKVWTVRVNATNAVNVGLTFDQFNLSSSARMYIYNDAQTELKGPMKISDFTSTSAIGIIPLSGSSIVIYIIENGNTGAFQSSVHISQVIAGFQPLGTPAGSGQASRTVNCDPLVQCYQDKMEYARAVAEIIVNGAQCTGTLLNNELQDGRAYFLTAWHCLDRNSNGNLDPSELSAINSAYFVFQLWNNNCNGGTINGGLAFSGAVLRAAWHNSDMALLELTNPPGIGDGVNYAGWNRQNTLPGNPGGMVLHHPMGKDMRITLTGGWHHYWLDNNFWQTYYTVGTVDKGSSGSGIFNEYNQVLGQLKGGWSSCDFTDFSDRYGKLYASFTGGGTSNTSLLPWLSPSQNLQQMSDLVLSPLTITGNSSINCYGGEDYHLPTLAGCSYSWSTSSNMTITSGQGTANVHITAVPQYNSGNIYCTITSNKGYNRTVSVQKNVSVALNIMQGYDTDGQIVTDQINWVHGYFDYQAWFTDPAILSVEWGLVGGNPSSWSYANNRLTFQLQGEDAQATFSAHIYTACGMQEQQYTFYTIEGGSWRVSPNPGRSTVTVTLNPEDLRKQPTNSKSSIQQLVVYDRLGRTVLRKSYANSQGNTNVNLDISKLKADVYILRMYDGKQWHSRKIIKE